MVRVGVIGAGPSGCAVLRAFQSAKENGVENLPELVVFEKQEDWGGLWNYSWRTGHDEHGEMIHGAMYRYLWSNGPKECLEFSDYSFEEHFGKAIPSYPPRAVLLDYVRGRLQKTPEIRNSCRFKTAVKNVEYSDESGKFTVTARELKEGREYSEEFDYVIGCCGHFTTPNVPEFTGFENFHGRVLHAKDFKDAVEFKDKTVLIVGASYSAEDIASQCYKYGAKKLVCSYRTNPMGWHWPDNFETRPLLQDVSQNKCTFIDGSVEENVDAIILCTGYQHYFPFISEPIRLKTANRLWPDSLYNGVVFMPNPKMFYVGMQDQWYTYNMFDSQAWLVRDYILGTKPVPDAAEMQQSWAEWRAREEALDPDYHDQISFQGAYVKSLIEMTDYPMFDIDTVNKTFYEWEENKHHGIMTFRDQCHRSVLTGTMSPAHHTPWLKAMDDSMEAYLDIGGHDDASRIPESHQL